MTNNQLSITRPVTTQRSKSGKSKTSHCDFFYQSSVVIINKTINDVRAGVGGGGPVL